MNHGTRSLLLLSGLAIAAAGTSAIAGQKGTKPVKHLMKSAPSHQFAASPRTMQQADAAQVRSPNGAVAQPLATELWSHLAVQKDAHGNPHQVETSGDAPPASIRRGLDNE